MSLFAPIIHINSNVPITFIFRHSNASCFFRGNLILHHFLFKYVFLNSDKSFFMLPNGIFNIHPTFYLHFHCFSTCGTQPLQRHGWLTFMTRVLKVKFYLKIITKLFIFENRIRFNTFLIEFILIGLSVNKTSIHCKSTNHLFTFRIDQPKLNISA
jgi:hypothetical protein